MIRALALLFLLAAPAAAEEVRPRVVSLDYCADQFVLGLADREQILAVSTGADKPHSFLRERAEGLRKIRSMTEDVIALEPDLVINHWGADARALAMFQRFDIKVHQVGWGSDIDAARTETLRAAEAMGQRARGDALVVSMPEAAPDAGLAALYVTPGGLTTGDSTMVGAIIQHAGLENAAGHGSWQELPLEALVLSPPNLALTAFFGFDTDRQDNWSLTRHPVMKRVLKDARAVSMNEARLTCPAWFVADEAAALAEAVR